MTTPPGPLLRKAMRERADQLANTPIRERSADGKRGYRDGYAAGARDALALVERFGSVAKAREDVELLLSALDAVAAELNQTEGTP